jgi:hypothetical protein
MVPHRFISSKSRPPALVGAARRRAAAGLMNATDLRAQHALPRAAEIRAAVAAAQVEPGNVIRNGEPAWRPGDGGSSPSLLTELTGCC